MNIEILQAPNRTIVQAAQMNHRDGAAYFDASDADRDVACIGRVEIQVRRQLADMSMQCAHLFLRIYDIVLPGRRRIPVEDGYLLLYFVRAARPR